MFYHHNILIMYAIMSAAHTHVNDECANRLRRGQILLFKDHMNIIFMQCCMVAGDQLINIFMNGAKQKDLGIWGSSVQETRKTRAKNRNGTKTAVILLTHKKSILLQYNFETGVFLCFRWCACARWCQMTPFVLWACEYSQVVPKLPHAHWNWKSPSWLMLRRGRQTQNARR